MLQAKPWNIVSNIKCLSVNGLVIHFTQFGIAPNVVTFDVPKQATEEDIIEVLQATLKSANFWSQYRSDLKIILRLLDKPMLKIKLQRLLDCSISLQFLARTKWTLESLPAACDALYTAVTNGLSDSQIVNYINDQLGDLQ